MHLHSVSERRTGPHWSDSAAVCTDIARMSQGTGDTAQEAGSCGCRPTHGAVGIIGERRFLFLGTASIPVLAVRWQKPLLPGSILMTLCEPTWQVSALF